MLCKKFLNLPHIVDIGLSIDRNVQIEDPEAYEIS